jgi:archaeosine synthase beta-subunit
MQIGDSITEQILRANEDSRKLYTFDESHDAKKPAMWWFQESHEGLILFIVYYTQACRWSRCSFCNLPSLCSKFHVDYLSIIEQTHSVFHHPDVKAKWGKIQKVIVSNNGSVLDQETFSTMALFSMLVLLNKHVPNLGVLTLESRVEFVEMSELIMLGRGLEEGQTPTALEIAVGLEGFDDTLRNQMLLKGLHLEQLKELARDMEQAALGADNGKTHDFRLKCYMLQKPVPGMTNQEAVEDVVRAGEFLGELARKHRDLRINMHLNPTFVSKGTVLEGAFNRGEFVPPILTDVAQAVLTTEELPITVYIGLDDEGLAVPGGSFRREGDAQVVTCLENFNRLQEYDWLRRAAALAVPTP